MEPIEDDIPTDLEDAREASDQDEDEIEKEKLVGVGGEPILLGLTDEE